MTDPHVEVLQANRALLASIDAMDWDAYSRLCDSSLSAFEPEACGYVVVGMDFHHFYFKLPNPGRARLSTMTSPHVRVMGDVAIVSYVRLTQRVEADGSTSSSASEETRVWQRQDGNWKHVHFHRSVP